VYCKKLEPVANQMCGPKLWNSLPAALRQTDFGYEHFKWLLRLACLGIEIMAHCD